MLPIIPHKCHHVMHDQHIPIIIVYAYVKEQLPNLLHHRLLLHRRLHHHHLHLFHRRLQLHPPLLLLLRSIATIFPTWQATGVLEMLFILELPLIWRIVSILNVKIVRMRSSLTIAVTIIGAWCS